ncbi:MAG: ABC transporter substrate-binding protein, partial [Myxococcota bacterium]
TNVKPKLVLKQLENAGLPVFLVKSPKNASEGKTMLRMIGKAVDRESQAKKLVQNIEQDLSRLSQLKKSWRKKKAPRVIFLYVRGTRTRFVMGRNSSISGMIALAGGKNVVSFDNYRSLSAEGLILLKPDVIVAFKRGVRSIGGLNNLHALKGVALTPAGRHKRFVLMDDLYLGGFGPRFGKAAIHLFRAFYIHKGSWVQPSKPSVR